MVTCSSRGISGICMTASKTNFVHVSFSEIKIYNYWCCIGLFRFQLSDVYLLMSGLLLRYGCWLRAWDSEASATCLALHHQRAVPSSRRCVKPSRRFFSRSTYRCHQMNASPKSSTALRGSSAFRIAVEQSMASIPRSQRPNTITLIIIIARDITPLSLRSYVTMNVK